MNPALAKNALLTTDYPIDVVIYRGSMTMSAGAYGYSDSSFPNTTGVEFLPIAQFSTSPNFDTVYDENTSPFQNGMPLYSTSVTVSSATITVMLNNNTPNSVTLYFRLIGLPLSTGVEYSYTNLYQSTVLNTDLNYQKLYMKGSLNAPANGNASVSHGLGYVPNFLAWWRDSSGVSRYTYADYWPGFSGFLSCTDSSLILSGDPFSSTEIHYRIYIDE